MCSKLADSIGCLQADPELHDHIQSAEMPPYFALGWFITWFSHSVQQLDQISRLFDLFMASHPLMPLYVVAQVMMVSFQWFPSRFCMSAQVVQRILPPRAAVHSDVGHEDEHQSVAEHAHHDFRAQISLLCIP